VATATGRRRYENRRVGHNHGAVNPKDLPRTPAVEVDKFNQLGEKFNGRAGWRRGGCAQVARSERVDCGGARE
jgi:hypothetical protein